MRTLLPLLAGALSAQTLVVDRPLTSPSQPVRIELPDGRTYADAFRIGSTGETWMIDRIRVWAAAPTGAACGREMGDSIAKITLWGALDNPPVPGQPVCDCHALVALAASEFSKGSSRAANPSVTAARVDGFWQLDFRDVRWSLPAASDALFTVRAAPRAGASCPAARQWALAASPGAEHQLHLLNDKTVPIGLEQPGRMPQLIRIQVWARRSQP